MLVADLVQRTIMRRAAHRYVGRRWPVVPGAYLTADRYECGPLCPTVACHPAVDQWEGAASCEPSDVEMWWAREPFSVLLATGLAFDVIEVPARIGLPAARAALLGPVAVTPVGRWMFLVQAGDALRPELSAQLDVVMHGRGSWIPAPPTRTPDGRVRWEVPPAATGWRLPDPYAVQRLLLAHQRPPGRVPTFASTTRGLRRAA
jgi:hypothetical protein